MHFLQEQYIWGCLKEVYNESVKLSPIAQYLPWTFYERSRGMFGRFHRNVQETFLELRKCPGFLNVLKQCSLNVPVERSRNVQKKYWENVQRAFVSNVRRTFRGNIQGTFAEYVLEHSAGTFFENVPGIIFYGIQETFFIDKKPDIFLVLGTFLERSDRTFRTFHGNVQGRYCAMGDVSITWIHYRLLYTCI